MGKKWKDDKQLMLRSQEKVTGNVKDIIKKL